MNQPEIPKNELKRLEELDSYKLIGLPESEDYDFITSMAAQICGTKISLVSLVTDEHQWFLSHHGLGVRQTPKVYAFCAHAINKPDEPLIIEDARLDERFYDNPLTTGDPNVIFYAGFPLVTSKGFPLGTLCAIDDSPKKLDEVQLEALKKLAAQVVNLFELRKRSFELELLNVELKNKNEVLRGIQNANRIGWWQLDIDSGSTIYSDLVYDILDVSQNIDLRDLNIFNYFYVDFRLIVSYAISTCIKQNEPFNLIGKVITAKERTIWVRGTGRKVGGKIIGSYQDITELKRDEIRFKSAIEGTNVGTWEWNVQTGETIFNERWCKILGYTLEELNPTSFDTWLRLSHPNDFAESRKRLKACFQEETLFYEMNSRMKHKGGHWVWVHTKGKVMEWTKDGKPLMMYGTHQDITERKKSEELLEKLSTEFAHLNGREFFDAICRDAALITGLDFVFVGELSSDTKSVSTLGGFALGQSMEHLKYDLEFTPCDNVIGKKSCIYSRNIQQIFPKDDLLKDMHIEGYFGFPLFSKDEKPVGIMVGMHCSAIDETKNIKQIFHAYSDRVSAEMQRGKSEEIQKELLNRFKHIGDNFPGAIYQFQLMPDGTMSFPYASSGISKIYGVTRDQMTQNGALAFNAIHPDDKKQVIESIYESAKNLTQWRSTFRVLISLEDTVWVEGSSSPQLQADGSIIWNGFVQDITDRKKAEDELLYNQNLLEILYDLIPIGIALNEYDSGRFLNVNDKLLESIGYSKEEFLSLNYSDITPPEYESLDLAALEQMEHKGSFDSYEKENIRKDGTRYPIITEGAVIYDNFGKKLIWSLVRDITEQKESERELQETISTLQAILDASKDFTIIATDKEGVITMFNSGAVQRLGYEPEEVIGKMKPGSFHLQEQIDLETSELSEKYNREINQLEAFTYEAKIGKPTTKEWKHVSKNGRVIPILLSVNAIKIKDEIVGYLGVAADISELKKREEEIRLLLDVTNEQNDRLRNFTQIVSHNLRSHSSGISQILELINIESPNASQNELMQYLQKGVDNLNQTVSDLNEIIKVNFSANEMTQVCIHDVIQKNIDSLSIQIKQAQLKIINNVDKNLSVKAVPAYLDSIALNMITNAIKYRSQERSSYLEINAIVDKSMIFIYFEDNGIGIDLKRHGDQLFGMYKTFHDHNDARGIGLFISKNQINSMRGKIAVESEVNVGTTFKIAIPK